MSPENVTVGPRVLTKVYPGGARVRSHVSITGNPAKGTFPKAQRKSAIIIRRILVGFGIGANTSLGNTSPIA